MAEPPGFFSREAGQARRRALNEFLNEGADYFLGPTGIPDRLRSVGELFNPIAAGEEASVDAIRAADPTLPPEERLRAAARSGANVAMFGIPGVLAARGFMPTTEALTETLTGIGMASPAVQEAVRIAIERANQPGPMPTVYMFGGRGTTNEYADRAMDRAEALRDQGLSPEDIWRTTAGEFPDAPATVLPDGRPFYEMPDAEALTQSLAQERAQALIDQALQATDPEERALLMGESRRLLDEQPAAAGVLSTPLVDVMTHPQLYQDFPRTGDINAQMAASLPSGVGGRYYPPASSSTAGVAQVSSRYRNQPQSQAEVLLHETQHGVAGVTGELPKGANSDTLRDYIARLENRTSQYQNDAIAESENLTARLDNLESYFAEQGPDAFLAYQQIVDPLIGRIGMAEEAAKVPYRSLTETLYGREGVSRGFQTQDPSYSLYHMDPGEALARLTASRREMSMAERGATTPMETLRQESRPIEWDELTKLGSEDDLRNYMQDRFNIDLSEPTIDGVDPYSYFRALNRTVSNSQGIIDETVNALSGVTDEASRRKIIAEGRDRVRADLQNRLERLSR
jgi:hypothetical protein